MIGLSRMNKPVVTSVPKAGALLGLGRYASYEAAKAGELPMIRIGRRMLVPLRALEDMLKLPPGSLKEADLSPDNSRKASA